ncbi:MAG: GAF domain-containing protein [Vicinamibacterales bacterium]
MTARLHAALPGAEACLFTPGSDDTLVVTLATPFLGRLVSGLSLPIGEGLAGWVAINRHTIANSHANLDLGPAAVALQLGACTATPVFALGELIGVLAVYLPDQRQFSEADIRFVGALAQELGLQPARPLLSPADIAA